MPIVLAGDGGGTLRAGRHLKFAQPTPMTNLYVATLDRMGVQAEKVGDNTGRMQEI